MSAISCPVCSGTAADLYETPDAGICCSCEDCGSFVISEASAISLGRYSGPMRRGLLSAAIQRTPVGALPIISHVD
jgi:hypothetical protein